MYFQALYGPWLFDDFTSVWPTKSESFGEVWQVAFENDSGLFGRSLPVVSFAVNFYFGGDSPFYFKLTNLFLHCLNFFLVYSFCRIFFQHLSRKCNEISPTDVKYLSLFCSLIWVLHPMHMSTVMYVVQRMAMMSAMFTLIALIVYLRYRTELHTLRARVLWFASISLLILFSCMCKENGALTVFYILLLEVLLFPRALGHCFTSIGKRNVWLLISVFSCVALFFSISLVRKASLMTGYELRDFGLVERLLTQPQVILFYLKNILLPNLDQLSLFHDGYVAQHTVNTRFFMSLSLIICLLILAFLVRKRFPVVSFGIGLFFLSHLLESTIFPLELVFEHRNYLGLLGVLLAVIFGFWIACRLYLSMKIGAVLLIIPLLGFAQQTYFRSIEWSSKQALLSAALENQPDSIRAKMGVTETLAGEGKLEELLVHLELCIKSHPKNTLFSIQKVMFTGALGRKDELALQQAIERLSDLPLRTTDLIGLNELYKFRVAGRFQWPSLKGVADMFGAASENKNIRIRPDVKIGLDRVYSQIVADVGSQ